MKTTSKTILGGFVEVIGPAEYVEAAAKHIETTISEQAGAVKPLPAFLENEIPLTLAEDARRIEIYFVRRGVKCWELGGICSRNHAYDRTTLLAACKALLACAVPTGQDTRTDRAMEQCRAAIAQAEGGQP